LNANQRRRKRRRAAAAAAAAAAAVAAVAAAGQGLPAQPDNRRADGSRVGGRCFGVASINVARECISKLCFVSKKAGDVQFDSREDR
jgi:uncharacterized membrane protein